MQGFEKLLRRKKKNRTERNVVRNFFVGAKLTDYYRHDKVAKGSPTYRDERSNVHRYNTVRVPTLSRRD